MHKTDLQSGKIAEIIIAWMLGYYIGITIEHDRRQYDKNIIVFRCGPDKSFKNNFYVKTMTGDTVLINLLEKSGLYNIEEIYEVFDEVEKLKDLIRTAWRYIKN